MKPIDYVQLLKGYNIHPVPLEFEQGLSTTEVLGGMQAKVNDVVDIVNTNQDELDSKFDTLKSDVDSTMAKVDTKIVAMDSVITDGNAMVTSLSTYENDITALENSNVAIIQDLNSKASKVELTKVETTTNARIDTVNEVLFADNEGKIKGVSLYFKTNVDILAITDLTLERLKTDGVTDIVLCPLLICNDTVTYNTVEQRYTLEVLNELVQKLITMGFGISIKFHLNLDTGNSIYSVVKPSIPATLFDTLRTIYLANLGLTQQFKIVMVANESPSITQDYRSYWESLFTDIKLQNPTIKITNSPTFDDIIGEKCVFWDICDYIGTNLYTLGIDIAIPTFDECKKAVICDLNKFYNNEYFMLLTQLARKYNVPFLITEWGILPYEYQLRKASNWQGLGAYNEEVQYNYYRGMFDVYLNTDLCKGMFIWNASDGFSFIGKQAENAVIEYYKGVLE